MPGGLEDLKIYKLAERLEVFVYKVTEKFPRDEKYRSVDQLRRSSSSVSDNISESYKAIIDIHLKIKLTGYILLEARRVRLVPE